MKRIILAVLAVLVTNGCNVQEFMDRQLAEENFKSLCGRYELAICGDIEIPPYSKASKYAILYDGYFEFVYKADEGERYDFIEAPNKEGDCEDWTITFLEKNLRLGNIKKGTATWMMGDFPQGGHVWLILEIDGEKYVFDNNHRTGEKLSQVYENEGYSERFPVYTY